MPRPSLSARLWLRRKAESRTGQAIGQSCDNNAKDDIIDIGDISVRDSSKATRAKLDAFRFAGLTITDLASLPTLNTYTEAKRALDAKK